MNRLARFITASLFVAVIAGVWDAWWHGAIGRDTLWEPPHILLYLAVTTAILSGTFGWYKTRQSVWKRLAIVLLIVPLSAPFDELWHRMLGREDFSSPLIVWSPPHVALVLSIIASFILLLPLIRQEEEVGAQQFFTALAFSGILALTNFLVQPIWPVGPWALLGFWGAGMIAGVFTFIILTASKWIPGRVGATLTIVMFVFLSAFTLEEPTIPQVVVPPHAHAPDWLLIFSFSLFGLIGDLGKRWPVLIKGSLMATLWAALLFGLSSQFFEPQFQYPFSAAMIAIFSSLLGGFIAALVVLVTSARKKTASSA